MQSRRRINGQRGLSTLAAIVLSALAGLTTATFLADWAVVRVRTPGPEVHNLTIPIPIVLGDMAAAFLPQDLADEAEIPPELKENKEAILEILGELIDAPDGRLISVDSDEANVRIGLKKGEILVHVDAPDAKVFCRLPLKGLRKALEKWDFETIEPDLLLKTLHSARSGNLVEVDAEDGTQVTISMF